MTIRKMTWAALLAAVLSGIPIAHAAPRKATTVKLSSPLAPGMVLQRDMPVPIWGVAAPGKAVTVAFGGQTKKTRADAEGKWSVTLDAMTASAKPAALVVRGDSGQVKLDNVLVGEVWLVIAGRLEKRYSVDSPVPVKNVRYVATGGGFNSYPMTAYGRNRPWAEARESETIPAVLITFANEVARGAGVPVGLVHVPAGKLPAIVPVEGFGEIKELRDVAERCETWYPATQRGRAAYDKWLAAMKAWLAGLDANLKPGKKAQPTQPPPAPGPTPGDASEPTVAYNASIHPIVPLAIRGAIHLDPDTGAAEPRYVDYMRALVAGLRKVFGRPDMPFAFTQLGQPGMYEQSIFGNETSYDEWYGHRDRQRRAAAATGAGLIVTADLEGYSPFVGERIALWALAAAYGRDDAACGPRYKSCRVEGDKIIVRFDNAHGGLRIAESPKMGMMTSRSNDRRLQTFSLAGEDRVFHTAEGILQSDGTVIVACPKVPKPVAVRYACRIDPRGRKLFGVRGMAYFFGQPASPFRSDDWPIEDPNAVAGSLEGTSPEKLAARLGDPHDARSIGAAMALGRLGDKAMGTIDRLLNKGDTEEKCGALRALGTMHWHGPVPRRYYGAAAQEITPAVRKALDRIIPATKDADVDVRYIATEALALIGAEDGELAGVLRTLATDDDPRIRCAALKIAKFRFNEYKHIVAMAYALLTEKPFGDRTSLHIAGNLINHQRINGPIDVKLVGDYLAKLRPGLGSEAVSSLGDALRRIKMKGADRPSLNSPDALPGVLNAYAIGYRDYMLYGVERWISEPENIPAFRAKIDELTAEIRRLKKDRSPGWEDRAARYADAIDGLKAMIANIEKQEARKARQKGK